MPAPLRSLSAGLASLASLTAHGAGPAHPNIVYILTDDLGYGDVSCLNPESKISTPNLDRLAASGMIFTDAHSNSAVCTPTRYGILTGRHAWRTELRKGVLWGFSPPLIPRDRVTVPAFLKSAGYATAMVGKWHLGIDWPLLEKPASGWDTFHDPAMDWSKPFKNGPTERGFDSFFGISASLDMPPYAYLEGDRIVGEITTKKNFSRHRTGPAVADFEAVRVLPDFAERACQDIRRLQAGGHPFFLYLSLNSPHTPIAPSPEFRGRSGINDYADFVIETDAVVGRVLDELERCGVRENTLVIFTSDNGCSPEADFKTLEKAGHHPSYVFRGAKADLFEGGHRVPFLVSWPARVRAGSTCADPVCLTDLFATAAEIVGRPVPPGAAEDSFSILPDLLETAGAPTRPYLFHQSIDGSLSIRRGEWKLLMAPGSGGWSSPKNSEAAGLPPVQLFNVPSDVGERVNVASGHPEIVSELTEALSAAIASGRTAAGPKARNDVEVPVFPPKGP